MTTKHRNGLLEVYRLIIGFWVLYCHDFFFFYNESGNFPVPNLAADFFFVMSGYFMLCSFQKLNGDSVLGGVCKLIVSRIKPLLFSICFIAAFAFVCIALFVRENYIANAFFIFRYWWYVLYLLIASAIIYFVYRLIHNDKGFIIFLVLLEIFTTVVVYFIEEHGILIYELTYGLRAFGCLGCGMIVSYVPRWIPKKFNYSIPIAVVLAISLVYLCYADKTFFTCIFILMLFALLVYFTMNIQVGGKGFDIVGLLGLRMYLYISFVSTLYILGLTNHRMLFVIDVTLATLDLLFTLYKQKYNQLKAKIT